MRNTKDVKGIQKKSKAHEVTPLGDDLYGVVSGASGQGYVVHLVSRGRQAQATCTCPWGTQGGSHAGQGRNCSHVAAVVDFIAQAEERTVSLWASDEEARRQHRPALKVDGLYYTGRRAQRVAAV